MLKSFYHVMSTHVNRCMPCSGAAQSDEEAWRVREAVTHAGTAI